MAIFLWLPCGQTLCCRKHGCTQFAVKKGQELNMVVFECRGCVVPIETASTAPHPPGALMWGWCTKQATKWAMYVDLAQK